ncbi:hypothetical protein GWI33_003828 [Rhynchophorus ferrugineus]|uniref:Uncharacterized protein n=1 Tax=Rhynchophorus ferrugineus TaxID=354439 RepID=A0A834IMU6_RHYFE|nr:hypothetical protein GWI33_003828 [Rhynchophorus ferrugineus]
MVPFRCVINLRSKSSSPLGICLNVPQFPVLKLSANGNTYRASNGSLAAFSWSLGFSSAPRNDDEEGKKKRNAIAKRLAVIIYDSAADVRETTASAK